MIVLQQPKVIRHPINANALDARNYSYMLSLPIPKEIDFSNQNSMQMIIGIEC